MQAARNPPAFSDGINGCEIVRIGYKSFRQADMDGGAYLVSLNIAHMDLLVVGGGEVATRKVKGLPEQPASLTVVAPEVSDGLVEFLSTNGSSSRILRRGFETSDLTGCDLVFAATSDPPTNSEISRLAHRLGILVNNVSDSSESSFANVATVNRGTLTIGVSSKSKAPGFSKAISRLIEDMLPADIDRVLVLAAEVRLKALSSGHSAGSLDWKKVLDSRVFEFIRSGDLARAEESLEQCLS